jgi:hypothetical protein
VTPPERGYTWEKGSVRRASRATEVLMRLFLLSLTIPTALTGCILVPFFLEPNGGNDSTPVWDSFDSSPWGGGGGGGGSNEFRPFAVFIDAEAVYDGREMDGYYLFANDSNSFQEPIVKFLFVEQAYFNNYNAQYACEWEGKITVLDRVDSRDTAWGAFEVQYTLVQTTCEDFNEATWANGDPTEAIESQTWFIGYGPMSQDFREEFRQAITQWGYAWSDYEPYVFSTWMGVANAAGASTTMRSTGPWPTTSILTAASSTTTAATPRPSPSSTRTATARWTCPRASTQAKPGRASCWRTCSEERRLRRGVGPATAPGPRRSPLRR